MTILITKDNLNRACTSGLLRCIASSINTSFSFSSCSSFSSYLPYHRTYRHYWR